MRTLKNRAWDTANKRWATESDFKEVGLFVNYYIDGSGKFELQADVNECGYGRFEIVEFTGLHDKNGKEIYEGDVVLIPSGTSTVIVDHNLGDEYSVYKKNEPKIGVVEFVKGSFRLNKPGDKSVNYYGVINYTGQAYNYLIEVIGNIYENPELLK